MGRKDASSRSGRVSSGRLLDPRLWRKSGVNHFSHATYMLVIHFSHGNFTVFQQQIQVALQITSSYPLEFTSSLHLECPVNKNLKDTITHIPSIMANLKRIWWNLNNQCAASPILHSQLYSSLLVWRPCQPIQEHKLGNQAAGKGSHGFPCVLMNTAWLSSFSSSSNP